MPDIPLSASDIRGCLREVADELPPTGPRHTIVIVGGSLLALHGLRQTTLDVDTVRRIDSALRDAVARVARVHDLAPAWLNDSSAAFRPQTFVEQDCDVVLDHARLLVLGAPLRQVFVMKLFAARVRTRDYEDLVALWSACGFASAEEAVELYGPPTRTRRRTRTWSSTSGASPTDLSTRMTWRIVSILVAVGCASVRVELDSYCA